MFSCVLKQGAERKTRDEEKKAEKRKAGIESRSEFFPSFWVV